MEKKFDKEGFLKEIHSFPRWVKNGDDLLKFCTHIHYRLLQEKAINAWYQDNMGKVSDEKFMEVNQIQHDYDEAYSNDKSEFLPFSEIFK